MTSDNCQCFHIQSAWKKKFSDDTIMFIKYSIHAFAITHIISKYFVYEYKTASVQT